jgi:hypothetical protein
MPHQVYVEVGGRRVFAAAPSWPGWCRSGREEATALQALVDQAPRYLKALGAASRGFRAPRHVSSLEVVERVKGDATTDFGAPSAILSDDDRPLRRTELGRLQRILEACWMAFDRAAVSARGATLRKGPRGGGRELDAIVSHVLEADRAYLSKLWAPHRSSGDADENDRMRALREAFIEALGARARGEPLPESGRRSEPWPARFAVRRSAWHALDHAWEIEDRAE